MPEFERTANVVWEGGLADGAGTLTVGSTALGELPVSWSARVESPDGRTSPEELVAAAHATCFAMAFSHALTSAGHPPEQLDVSARVSAELGDGGLRITASELTVRGRVPGLDRSEFSRHAEDAERACPVSTMLRSGIEISINADLAD
jgi:osmotically inducible protein OsmC